MKHVEACLSVREDQESCFHSCGGPMRLVEACFCAGKTTQGCFTLRLSAVKHVEASLSAREDR